MRAPKATHQSTCVDGCVEDGNCANGQICTNRECVTGCRNDDACHVGTPASTISTRTAAPDRTAFGVRAEQVCDRLNGRCVDCLQKVTAKRAGCATDRPCRANVALTMRSAEQARVLARA